MLHMNFRKCPCHVLLFSGQFQYEATSYITCHFFRNTLCHVAYFLPLVARFHVTCHFLRHTLCHVVYLFPSAAISLYSTALETFMGVDQRTGEGSKPRTPRVVSKSDSDHWSGYYGHRTLGLTPGVLFAIVPAP